MNIFMWKQDTCSLNYDNVVNYGFVDLNYRDWKKTRIYNADEYVEYLSGTQVEHITLQEPYRSNFNNGVREAVIHGETESFWMTQLHYI